MEIIKIVILSTVSAVILFLLTKIMGNKQISQLSMFDYVTGITIGSIAAEMATELEENPLNPIVAMIIYALLAFGISILTEKSVGARKILAGRPILLLDNGILYRSNLSKARMDISDFMMLCRVQGYFDIGQIQTAILEFNGSISIIPKSDQRPVTPGDMNMQPKQETVLTNVILDGKVMKKNLKFINHNEKWLEKHLKEQGYKSAKDVFLATCDAEGNLSVYPMVRDKIKVDWFE